MALRTVKNVMNMVLLAVLLLTGAGVAEAAYQPDLLVKAATDGDAAYVGNAVFEATATAQSRSQPAFPGTSAAYVVLVKNAGDAADSFVVTGTGDGSAFTVQYLDEEGGDKTSLLTGAGFSIGPLASGESRFLLVRVRPTVTTLGSSSRVALTAVSAGDRNKLDQVKTETVVCGTSAAVIVSVPLDASGVPGSVVTYPYTVTNVGSDENSFSLAVSNSAGWGGTIFADDGAGGGIAGDGVRQSGENTVTASTGPLPPGASYRCFVAVTIPLSSADGTHTDTRLAVAGEGASAADQVTTTALAATISVAENVRNLTLGGPFLPIASAYPGDTLEYRMSITNSGQATATSVSIDAPIPAHVAYLPDTLRIGTAAEGDAAPCPSSQCGVVRQAGGAIYARLGEGATEAAGGSLSPGRTLHVFYRVQVE